VVIVHIGELVRFNQLLPGFAEVWSRHVVVVVVVGGGGVVVGCTP